MRLSRSTRVDGLWVGALGDENDTEVLCKIGEALQIIKAYDMFRYRRVLKEIDRIWAHPLPVKTACFVAGLRRCLIDNQYASPVLTLRAMRTHFKGDYVVYAPGPS